MPRGAKKRYEDEEEEEVSLTSDASETEVAPKKKKKARKSEKSNWPTLYKKNAKGGLQWWTISVEGSTIVTEWGVEGTENPQRTEDEITEGKNVGKSNETSPREQAQKEATARHVKQLKKGYTPDKEGATDGAVDQSAIVGGLAPMLAHVYSKHVKKVVWPVFAQPKLDGHRCVAEVRLSENTVRLWTRTRKPINNMGHVCTALLSLVRRFVEAPFSTSTFTLTDTLWLDGELYNHELRSEFERLTHLIRAPATEETASKVKYYVYDVVDTGAPQDERTEFLAQLFRHSAASEPLVLVPTDVVENEEELNAAFSKYRRAGGYEGVMVRAMKGKYALGKRSTALLKLKEFEDAEFKVTGVLEGRGKLAGHAIFECETKAAGGGQRFTCKMHGDTAALKEYWEHPERAVGRLLTVQFQGLTSAGIPRFPVALRFHETL